MPELKPLFAVDVFPKEVHSFNKVNKEDNYNEDRHKMLNRANREDNHDKARQKRVHKVNKEGKHRHDEKQEMLKKLNRANIQGDKDVARS